MVAGGAVFAGGCGAGLLLGAGVCGVYAGASPSAGVLLRERVSALSLRSFEECLAG